VKRRRRKRKMDRKQKPGKPVMKRKVIGNERSSQSQSKMTKFFSPISKGEKKEENSCVEKMATGAIASCRI
jgi:hypothetical protein